ncbi:MAG: thiamine-phosphate kinase [Gloeobacterales cyanobacterium]
MTKLLLKDLGEQGLLQELQPFFAQQSASMPVPVGDDAAVVCFEGDLVITKDLLVDGVHFSDQTTGAEAVGWRAAAANLSDLAAMGASPVGLLVGLALPGDTPLDWILGVYRGLAHFGVPILGGDTVRSSQRVLSITALGKIQGLTIRRNQAQVGDQLLVTGPMGSARAGLELLLYPEKGKQLSQEDAQILVQAHQRPTPRLDIPPLLFAETRRIGGMDTSDGLADAVLQVCRASGVGALIDHQSVPILPAVRMLAGEQALDWAYYGGEDFELLLSVDPMVAEKLLASYQDFTIIGTVTPGPEVLDDRGVLLTLDRSFQHF